MSETLESPKTKAETHKIMGGKVNIYRRENSDNWQCSTFLNGRNWRVSTHEDGLGRAKDFAEDWYLALRGTRQATAPAGVKNAGFNSSIFDCCGKVGSIVRI